MTSAQRRQLREIEDTWEMFDAEFDRRMDALRTPRGFWARVSWYWLGI